jgi:glycerophosphoryl diester phosphodiesterase
VAAIWAHRGASAIEPENTLEAFRAAKALGADGVELDVRRSRDSALVIRHDATLSDGRIIHELGVGDLPPEVPLLDAALDACDGMVVNIEIKNVQVDIDFDPSQFLAEAVVALVQERKAHGDVVVSCFGLDAIDRVRALDPSIPTGYLTSATWDQVTSLQRAIDGGHTAFHPYHLVVNRELVVRAHDAGLTVNTWTVDEPDRIRWLVEECRVDAIVTNVPDVARSALR